MSGTNKKSVALVIVGCIAGPLIAATPLGTVWGVSVTLALMVAAIVLWKSGQRDEDNQTRSSNNLIPKEVTPDVPQETGPEIMLRCERMFYESDESLVVQYIGDGSVRNIQLGQMNNGNWTADFDPISYISVGGEAQVKPRFTPVSPLAICERATGRTRMTLKYFLMTSIDVSVGPIQV